ncbi:MAG: hypothetical protein IPL56_16205 [Saprospiraceae bacterium]|nr:hypothetical protein [Saprospiraceae bacterium]MBK8513753.1 hypothetical protein [Saprospiraceae bacterium]MBP7921627.1 hypothetical protein [Saprospiraceae bacterium]
MTIQFTKGDTARRSTIFCIREDGSSTYSYLHPGIEVHDLAHYAVETILSFDQSFFGLLRAGYQIADFEAPRDKRVEALLPANIPVQSIQTEYLVNQLMTELNSGPIDHFIEMFKSTLQQRSIDYPSVLDEDKLKEIRSLFSDLIRQWNCIRSGERLELCF